MVVKMQKGDSRSPGESWLSMPCLVLAWGTLAESMLLKRSPGHVPGLGVAAPWPASGAVQFFPSWWRNAWDEDRREVLSGLAPAPDVERVRGTQRGVAEAGAPSIFLRNAARMRRLCRSGNFLCLQSLCEFRKSVELLGFKALMYCLRVFENTPK